MRRRFTRHITHMLTTAISGFTTAMLTITTARLANIFATLMSSH